MKASDIETVDDLRAYIEMYRKQIYIREYIDGKWGSYNLDEIPKELADAHIKRFLDEGRIPVRLIE